MTACVVRESQLVQMERRIDDLEFQIGNLEILLRRVIRVNEKIQDPDYRHDEFQRRSFWDLLQYE